MKRVLFVSARLRAMNLLELVCSPRRHGYTVQFFSSAIDRSGTQITSTDLFTEDPDRLHQLMDKFNIHNVDEVVIALTAGEYPSVQESVIARRSVPFIVLDIRDPADQISHYLTSELQRLCPPHEHAA